MMVAWQWYDARKQLTDNLPLKPLNITDVKTFVTRILKNVKTHVYENILKKR